jgi:hypothetical protein
MSLVRKAQEVVPPKTEEEYYDTIMARKNTLSDKVKSAFVKTFIRVASRLSR